MTSPGDLPIGVFFTRKGGDVSYPLEGWAVTKYDLKDGAKRGCFEIAHEGTVALLLDNSSSRLKTKTVKFSVQSRATTEQYEMDEKLAGMKAAQNQRQQQKREKKLGRTSTRSRPMDAAASAAGGEPPKAGGPPRPRAPKPAKPAAPKPSAAAAAAAAYEAAEAEAEASALFQGSVSSDGDLGSPGGAGGIKRAGKKKRPATKPAALVVSAEVGDLDFMADAEAARKEEAAKAAAGRKAKQRVALEAKKDLQKDEMKRKAAAKAKARQAAKTQADSAAVKAQAEAERDRQEELRFQKQKQAQEDARKAREEMEREAQAALERARAAAEERRQAQAAARQQVEQEKEAKKALRLAATEAAREEARLQKEEEKAAREELRKKREAEEAMKIEMYDPSGKVMRRLGRYTVQEENGYVRGWTCDICLQIKAGTFYFADETVLGEEDTFRGCARCLVDGGVIDISEDLEIGEPGPSFAVHGQPTPFTPRACAGSEVQGFEAASDDEDGDADANTGLAREIKAVGVASSDEEDLAEGMDAARCVKR